MESLNTTQSLLDYVAGLRKDCLASEADNAPNFNLFRILDVEQKEVSTHSAFLAHLLTPSEGHAQGHFFLHHFLLKLEELKYTPKHLASFYDDWTVSKELPFLGGRLDIVLQSVNASAIIIIENKVGTEDHANQLSDYYDWLNEPHRRRSFKTRLLLYLTPNGDLATNARENIYKPFSYSKDITQWLESCLSKDKVKPSRVKESIKTYVQTIKNLNTPTLMKDDFDESIISHIATPEHRIAALRITRVGDILKEKILEEFWDKGKKYLNNMLEKEGLTSYWKLEQTDGSHLQLRYGIEIVGKGVDREKPHPEFVFFQLFSETHFRWELTVKYDAWCGKQEKIKDLPEALKLAEVMNGLSMPKKRGWDGYCLFSDDSKGIERTLEHEIEKKEKKADVSVFFETGWMKFQKLEPHLKRLNNAVRRVISVVKC